jgi:hypothetical protein
MDQPEKEVKVVFAESALHTLTKMNEPDLLSKEQQQRYSEVAEKHGPVMALSVLSLELPSVDKIDEIGKKLIEHEVALTLKEFAGYFTNSGFTVDSMALNVAGKLGTDILLLSAEASAGFTITVTPKP